MKNKIWNRGMLACAALIWGIAFVAQSVGMEYVGPFTFNAVRFVIGGAFLVPCILLIRKVQQTSRPVGNKKMSYLGGVCCGTALFVGSSLQQIGIMDTSVGKAGFITALYIIIVPLIGLFTHKKISALIWISAVMATVGMYFLCITEGFTINRGDFFVFLCAIGFSIHIIVIDYFSPKADGLIISCIQFFTAGILSAIVMLLFEKPQILQILHAWKPVLYAGIMSCGIAYTLQVLAQKYVEPTVASLILSLESVFSVLAGWIILGQKMSIREIGGCILVFIAIIFAQVKDSN